MKLSSRIILLLSAFASGFSAQAAIQSAIKPLPLPEIETLANGLQVAWYINDKLPLVDLVFMVRAGSRQDEVGKSGTAELLSASLDRGSGTLNAQGIARAIERLGASRSVSADEDFTSVALHGLAMDSKELLRLLGEIAINPKLEESEIQIQKERMLDQFQHLADYGESLSALTFQRVVTRNTPYGRGAFASIAEFKKIQPQDVARFYRAHFTPKNSILMIVGRVNREELKKQILQQFGPWVEKAPTVKTIPQKAQFNLAPYAQSAPRIYIVDRPQFNQAQIRMGFVAPPIQSPDRIPLAIASTLLGEYFHSRLNARIRDELGLAYGIQASFSYHQDLGVFQVASATQNSQVGQLLSETLSILNGIRDRKPITAPEVQMTKDYLIGAFPVGTATVGAIAVRWLTSTLYGLGTNSINEFIPKVAAATQDQIQQAIRRHLGTERMAIVIVGNASEIKKSLAKSPALPSVREVKMNDLF